MKKILHKISVQINLLISLPISIPVSALLLSAMLVCSVRPLKAAAYEIPGTYQIQTDDGTSYAVKTLDHDYDNNTYFSLRDIAMLLKDTEKSFSLEITKNTVTLIPGGAYTPVGAENTPWEEDEKPEVTLRRNEFKVNEQKVFYYTMISPLSSGGYDCFMMAADLAMILDMDITVPDAGFLQIHTQTPFSVSPAALEKAGYFYGVNSVLVGDATTGEVYYAYQSDMSYPIASTSKLMTCLLALEAVSTGQISLDEQVTISEAVQALAVSSDGVLPLTAGEQITVQELLTGALLPSSNECALCLAEAIAGSEEAFVQLMSQKAQELGLSQAVFYNSNGLPSYTEDSVPAKRQNSMSAEDMFRLVSYLLKVYPQITDITSLEKADLPSLGIEVSNTNPLLRNLSGVTGLKTGTTNKAGACLVTSLTAEAAAGAHDLVVIVLGTEDSIERGRVSGLLARYALHTFYAGMEDAETGMPETENSEQVSKNLPIHAEAAIDQILRTARKN
ncbi:MAG: D-alanyl-D-alanine carboxypeptidase [Ruminococcus flavefaciens]|nr:D-alanyl-D-alanine carboxypeptidase [Roseburia sp.]MCM1231418.1 D-alanyl-D-alanine carboxypeptidase [Ruminococcus flavefaciens]